MTSDVQTERGRGVSKRIAILLMLAAVIVIDVLALFVAPPFDKADPSGACAFPVCFINGNLELPAPHVVWRAAEGAAPADLITFDVSISSTILTMWIVSVLVIVRKTDGVVAAGLLPSSKSSASNALDIWARRWHLARPAVAAMKWTLR